MSDINKERSSSISIKYLWFVQNLKYREDSFLSIKNNANFGKANFV